MNRLGRLFPPGRRRPTQIQDSKSINTLLYTSSIIVAVVGLVYASVPLYRLFCQTTGFAGTPKVGHGTLQPERMHAVPGARPIQVSFIASTGRNMAWKFEPQQRHVIVKPGQTALAFYTATNQASRDVTGIATYNVIPAKAGAYFNKIQCFCFEEQKLRAGEQVDMPIFFYLDPDFANDSHMADVEQIVLSYTFFDADSRTLRA